MRSILNLKKRKKGQQLHSFRYKKSYPRSRPRGRIPRRGAGRKAAVFRKEQAGRTHSWGGPRREGAILVEEQAGRPQSSRRSRPGGRNPQGEAGREAAILRKEQAGRPHSYGEQVVSPAILGRVRRQKTKHSITEPRSI